MVIMPLLISYPLVTIVTTGHDGCAFQNRNASAMLNTMINLIFFQLIIMVVNFKSEMASAKYFTLPCALTQGTFPLHLSNQQFAFKQ